MRSEFNDVAMTGRVSCGGVVGEGRDREDDHGRNGVGGTGNGIGAEPACAALVARRADVGRRSLAEPGRLAAACAARYVQLLDLVFGGALTWHTCGGAASGATGGYADATASSITLPFGGDAHDLGRDKLDAVDGMAVAHGSADSQRHLVRRCGGNGWGEQRGGGIDCLLNPGAHNMPLATRTTREQRGTAAHGPRRPRGRAEGSDASGRDWHSETCTETDGDLELARDDGEGLRSDEGGLFADGASTRRGADAVVNWYMKNAVSTLDGHGTRPIAGRHRDRYGSGRVSTRVYSHDAVARSNAYLRAAPAATASRSPCGTSDTNRAIVDSVHLYHLRARGAGAWMHAGPLCRAHGLEGMDLVVPADGGGGGFLVVGISRQPADVGSSSVKRLRTMLTRLFGSSDRVRFGLGIVGEPARAGVTGARPIGMSWCDGARTWVPFRRSCCSWPGPVTAAMQLARPADAPSRGRLAVTDTVAVGDGALVAHTRRVDVRRDWTDMGGAVRMMESCSARARWATRDDGRFGAERRSTSSLDEVLHGAGYDGGGRPCGMASGDACSCPIHFAWRRAVSTGLFRRSKRVGSGHGIDGEPAVAGVAGARPAVWSQRGGARIRVSRCRCGLAFGSATAAMQFTRIADASCRGRLATTDTVAVGGALRGDGPRQHARRRKGQEGGGAVCTMEACAVTSRPETMVGVEGSWGNVPRQWGHQVHHGRRGGGGYCVEVAIGSPVLWTDGDMLAFGDSLHGHAVLSLRGIADRLHADARVLRLLARSLPLFASPLSVPRFLLYGLVNAAWRRPQGGRPPARERIQRDPTSAWRAAARGTARTTSGPGAAVVPTCDGAADLSSPMAAQGSAWGAARVLATLFSLLALSLLPPAWRQHSGDWRAADLACGIARGRPSGVREDELHQQYHGATAGADDGGPARRRLDSHPLGCTCQAHGGDDAHDCHDGDRHARGDGGHVFFFCGLDGEVMKFVVTVNGWRRAARWIGGARRTWSSRWRSRLGTWCSRRGRRRTVRAGPRQREEDATPCLWHTLWNLGSCPSRWRDERRNSFSGVYWSHAGLRDDSHVHDAHGWPPRRRLRARLGAHLRLLLLAALLSGSISLGWLGQAGAVRYGEAENPGPPAVNEGDWECHGSASFKRPHRPGFGHALMDVGEFSEPGGDQAPFTLVVDTCNSTAWSGAKRYLRRTSADVVLLQEHHLQPSRIAGASAWALKHDWHSVFLPAMEGSGGGWRGGVAVLARPHVGLSMPSVGPAEIVPARAVAASIEPPGFRRCTVISAYLADGLGMGATNLGILQEIGRCATSQGEHVPCIMGGDWQAAPETVAATGFATQTGMTLVATGHARGTYRAVRSSSELDYFLLTNDLALGLDNVQTVEGSAVRPHVPVRITFRPRMASIRALHVRCPPPLPIGRIVGPLRQPPDWRRTRAWAEALANRAADAKDPCGSDFAKDFARLYEVWSDMAEEELIEATGAHFYGEPRPRKLRGRAPLLKWRSIVSERPPRRSGDESQVQWRNMAARAVEVQRALHHMIAATTNGDHDVDAADADDDPEVDDRGAAGVDDHADGASLDHIAEAMYILNDMQKELAEVDAAQEVMQQVVALSDVIIAAGIVADRAGAAVATADRDALRCSYDQVGNLLDRLAEVRTAVNKEVVRSTEAARSADIEEWRRWVAHNIEAGARNAHRYLQLPEEWRPTTLETTDGTLASSPIRLLQTYRDKYERLWNHRRGPGANGDREGTGEPTGSRKSDEWRPWHDVTTRSAFPRATPAQLREASLTFKERTLVAFDGVAMRHYALLSDEALETLADILLVVEYLGHLPGQLRFTVMPLIAKARGGHRAIASLVSLYRLWSRLRREEARKWEAAHDRPYLAAGKGRGPQDAVWRQAARAEAASGAKRQVATALWDLASFFETIRRVPLWHRARRLHFPMTLLRVALNAYAAPRALSLCGALARPQAADDGVLAGCGLAMTLTRVFVIEAMDQVVCMLAPAPPPCMPSICDTRADDTEAEAHVDMYVDDVAATVVGNSKEQVMGKMEETIGVLRHAIEDVLGCTIEVEKAAMIASSAPLATAMKRRFGALAGPAPTAPKAAPNLGIDYAAGRPRRVHASSGKRRRRMTRLTVKAGRLSRIRAIAGKRTVQIFTAGPMAEAVYGAAVNGLSGAEVQTLRRAAACAFSPRARGRSLTTVLLMAGAPTWKGEVECVLQYARQVWAAVRLGAERPRSGELTLPQISAIWHGAVEGGVIPEPGRRAWAQVRGPIGAAQLTLQRVGWKFVGPFTIEDSNGEAVKLTETSPALLGQLLRRAVIQTMEASVGAKLAAHDPRFEGRRVAVDHVTAQLSRDRSLSAADKAAYRSVACGALMTYSRAARSGYLVRDVCPLCGMVGDTIRHRVWCCQHPTAVAARNAAAPLWLRQEAVRREASDSFWVHGFIPHPGDVWPRPASQPQAETQFGDGGREAPTEDFGTACNPRFFGRVFGDGSCTSHIFPELRRAATSLVQRRADGGRGWILQCPVPSPLPQTPQAAEYAVLALAARFSHPEAATVVASDCLNVVRSYTGPAREATAPGRAYAGIMRQVLGDVGWAQRTTVRKVKAHRDPATVSDPEERLDAIDNGDADVAAKDAISLHPQPSPAQVADLDAMLKRSRLIVRTIARVTQVFPPMPADRMQRPPRAREGAALRLADNSHDWEFSGGLWRCRTCMRITVRTTLTHGLATQRCEGPKAAMAAQAIAEKGHVLARTNGAPQIIFCVRCGAFSARRTYGLGARCSGVPKPSGQQALARIKKGQQPWEIRTAGGRYRGTVGDAMAWDSARQCYVSCGPARPNRRREHKETRADAAGGGDRGDAAMTDGCTDMASGGGAKPADSASTSRGRPVGSEPLPTHADARVTAIEDIDMTDAASPEDETRRVATDAGEVAHGSAVRCSGGGGSTLHRDHEAPGDGRGRHRQDGGHSHRGPHEARAQQRLSRDHHPVPGGPTPRRQRQCGPALAAAAGLPAPQAPIGGTDPLSNDISDSYPACSARPPGTLGPHLRDAPLRRVRQRTDAGPPAPGDGQLGLPRRSASPRERHARHLHGEAGHALLRGPPSWLYLPHLGAGDGSDFLREAGLAVSVHQHGASATGVDDGVGGDADGRGASGSNIARHRAAHNPSAATVSGPSREHRVGPHTAHLADGEGSAGRARIRGRAENVSMPPGATASTEHRPHGPRPAPIRGRDATPGPTDSAVTVRATGEDRLRARLEASHSAIKRSLEDHADRVAAKKARLATASAASDVLPAADRLAAIRARVAARCAAAVAISGDAADPVRLRAHLGADALHAAAHAADHGGELRPAAGVLPAERG